jgi:hypothetical protein
MKLLIIGLFLIGLSLVIWGTSITNGSGSADERVAGAYPVLFGAGLIVLDVAMAFVWLLFRS